MKIYRFEDIEYRRGSKEFGGLVLKIMEFLRLYRKDNSELVFTVSDFEKQSKISIDEIKKLISDERGKNLLNINIKIDNDKIYFTNLKSDKNRFFENNLG